MTQGKAIVHKAGPLQGRLQVPGDKSISHRVAMLAGISEGVSRIKGFLRSEDCLYTLRAMEQLGASVTIGESEITVEGTGGALKQPEGRLDLGNSGTGIRLLSGLVAGNTLTVSLTGDDSLCTRPMQRIQIPLELMGAEIRLTGEKGTPPIDIKGGGLKAITYELPMASAQVKSCVLLAALYADGVTRVVEPKASRDHTERLLRQCGVPVDTDGLTVTLEGFGAAGPTIQARDWQVPGDISSAAFWIVAAAMSPGSNITIENVGLNPRRTAILDVLKRMGADITVTPHEGAVDGEPSGDVQVTGSTLRGTVLEPDEIPNLIDEIPILAVAAALAEGTTEIRNAAELRVKESDRIRTVVDNLRAANVQVEEFEDGMNIHGPAEITGGHAVESHGDHRIAMAFSILAMHAEESVEIRDIECINTSYPTYWDDLVSFGGQIER